MFRERLITAFILLGFVFAGIAFLPHPVFAVICALIALMGSWEWTNLMGLTAVWQRASYLALIALLCVGIIFLPILGVCGIAILVWILNCYWIMLYPRHLVWTGKFKIGLMGCFIFPPAWQALVYLRIHHGGRVLLAMLFLVWAADSGAYVFGRLIGKHKLIPHVSPGKTVEGLIGGMFCGIVLLVTISLLFKINQFPWHYYLLIGVVSILFSVVGDLLISMLKRERKIKDSGTLLPGHGGLLDRVDSLMAAAPCFLFGLLLLKMV